MAEDVGRITAVTHKYDGIRDMLLDHALLNGENEREDVEGILTV